jgi:outer membrane protein TolC
MPRLVVAAVAFCVLVSGCATKLQAPPPKEQVLEEALPETTEIRLEWAAPAEDTGQVDDDWLASFEDPQLDALVDEALNVQNPNLRVLSTQVDRAQAAAVLAGSALKPTVSLGADLSGTAGPDPVEQQSAGGGVAVSWEAHDSHWSQTSQSRGISRLSSSCRQTLHRNSSTCCPNPCTWWRPRRR